MIDATTYKVTTPETIQIGSCGILGIQYKTMNITCAMAHQHKSICKWLGNFRRHNELIMNFQG